MGVSITKTKGGKNSMVHSISRVNKSSYEYEYSTDYNMYKQ